MKKHTPEPWLMGQYEANQEFGFSVERWAAPRIQQNQSGLFRYDDACRMIDCVNACEGIGRPHHIWELIQASRMLMKAIEVIDRPVPCSQRVEDALRILDLK